MARFRYNFTAAGPAFITTGDAELVQYTHGMVIDVFLERVRQSALARLPVSTVTTESVGLIASGLGFTRGESESDAQFLTRISEWLQPWSRRTKGGYYALLRQIALVLGLPAGTRVKAVTRNGFWVQYVDNVITYGILLSAVTTANNGFWVGASAPALPAWAYVYIVIENHPGWSLPTGLLVGDVTLWGGTLGATDDVIGLGGANGKEIADIRTLIREWLPLGVSPVELLFNAAPGSQFPQTGVDTGTAGVPNYTALVPSNLVRIPL